MLGFKQFRNAAIIIGDVALLRRIHNGQFDLGRLRIKGATAPTAWNAVLGC